MHLPKTWGQHVRGDAGSGAKNSAAVSERGNAGATSHDPQQQTAAEPGKQENKRKRLRSVAGDAAGVFTGVPVKRAAVQAGDVNSNAKAQPKAQRCRPQAQAKALHLTAKAGDEDMDARGNADASNASDSQTLAVYRNTPSSGNHKQRTRTGAKGVQRGAGGKGCAGSHQGAATYGEETAKDDANSFINQSENFENAALFSSINDAISKCSQNAVAQQPLELDTVLSRVPYYKMLQDLFGGSSAPSESVPIITAAYEEQYMRECTHANERACVMGENCECMFIDPTMPFVAVEFVLPTEAYSENPQLCVLCSRKVTQRLFYDMMYKGYTFHNLIQRYGNICDQPGEYARECMLICPPNQNVHCMPLPIVSHQRNRYSVYLSNGTKYIKQHRVYAKDFH